MSSLRKVYLLSFMFILTSLSLAIEAKADPVQLTLTNTVYDASSGSFTLTGFFTNSGSATFTANGWSLTFSPDLGQHGQSAVNLPTGFCCTYNQPVPGMSSSSIIPLLTISPRGQPPSGSGTYIGTLTFSGVDSNGVTITTAPVQFAVNVPVPEPATMLLLSTGLMAAGSSIRRRRIATKEKPDPREVF
jgi:hypothetical protein